MLRRRGRPFHGVMRAETITGWGRFPVTEGIRLRARSARDLQEHATATESLLPQGNCRSYGDACLWERVVSTLPLDRLLDFDPGAGLLRAEAGVTLANIIRFILPRGWFLPVTPGTKFPTLGGCVAADIHGKNHHAHGSIARFVETMEMVVADGSRVQCSPTHNADLFAATVGGMGLTGFIYSVSLKLIPVDSAFLAVDSERTKDLRHTCRLLVDTQDQYVYSVAWLDCAIKGRCGGRGIVMLGNHARAGAVPRQRTWQLHPDTSTKLPVPMPGWTLNRLTVRTFNSLYCHRHWRRRRQRTVHYDPFFYPLDGVANWNLLYGNRGFLQYQFAVPFADGVDVIADVLDRLQHAGFTPTLAVLKTFGDWSGGMLSFPIPGYTLALDLPVADGRVVGTLKSVSAAVTAAGGRVYLAKDAVLTRDDFEAMYSGLAEFRQIKRHYDPDCRFRSRLSDRLGLT